LSFPEREGGPLRISAMVDRFLHRPYDSLLPFCWIGSNTVSKFTLGVLTPYPLKRVLSPFQGDTSLLSFPEREGGPAVWLVDGFLHRPYDSSLPFCWIGSNTVSKFTLGVQTPYPLKRALSPFQGDTMLFPFSAGLGDSSSSSPSRGTQIFVLPWKGRGTVAHQRNGG
jgi:hypothetical protein